MAEKVFNSHAEIKQHSLGGVGKPAPSERTMHREHGQPIYSSNPGPPRQESNPAFSGPIAPGPNENKPLQSGPGWIESMRNKTPVQHSPNKQDGKNIGRGRVVTY